MSQLEITFKYLRRGIGIVWIFSTIASLLLLTNPLYMSSVYDKVLSSRSLSTLAVLTMMAIVALMVLGAIDAIRRMILSRLSASVEADLSSYLLENALLNERSNPDAAMEGMGHLNMLRNFITSPAMIAIFDLPIAPIFLIIMFYLHPLLGLLTIGGAAVLAIMAIMNQRMADPSTKSAAKHSQEATAVAHVLTRNSETVRAMGMTDNVIGIWGSKQAQSIIETQEANGKSAWISSYSKIVRSFLQLATLGLAAILVIQGALSPGMIFVSSIVSGRALSPIDAIISNWKNITTAREAYKHIKEIISNLDPMRSNMRYSRPTGHIDVEQVGYHIEGSPIPILQGFSFSIPTGRTLGLIGASGAGKSTLARIIAGSISPSRGVVKFDGIDISTWDRTQLGRFIGYVPQDIELFPGSVAQNIARFDPDLSLDAVIEVAKITGIHDFIQNLPQGYNTILGQGAFQPSGGQRQRIAIARAFYGNPAIIIMDEPNASLDGAGEAALVNAIGIAKGWGATVLVVSHRPALLQAVDTILILDQGRIKDYGERDEVLSRGSMQGMPQPQAAPAMKPMPAKSEQASSAQHAKENEQSHAMPKEQTPPQRSPGKEDARAYQPAHQTTAPASTPQAHPQNGQDPMQQRIATLRSEQQRAVGADDLSPQQPSFGQQRNQNNIAAPSFVDIVEGRTYADPNKETTPTLENEFYEDISRPIRPR